MYKLVSLIPASPPLKTDHEIANWRTETPEESLSGSLLSVLTANSTNLTQEVMDEAFCRDMEAFSEAFIADDPESRPGSCKPVNQTLCAVLYDR